MYVMNFENNNSLAGKTRGERVTNQTLQTYKSNRWLK